MNPSGHEQQSAGDNAENNYGCIQTPEALQQPSVQAWMNDCIKKQLDFEQEGTNAMINNVYGKEGASAESVQGAGTLSDINSGPKNPSDGGAESTAPVGSYEPTLQNNTEGGKLLVAGQKNAVADAVNDTGGGETSYGKSSEKNKTGPKPKGTGPHNLKIEEIASQVTDGQVIAGGGVFKERVIPTPNGIKSSRRPDILVQKPDGSLYGINVGKTTANGAPIKREVETIYDLEDAGIPMYFVPYDK